MWRINTSIIERRASCRVTMKQDVFVHCCGLDWVGDGGSRVVVRSRDALLREWLYLGGRSWIIGSWWWCLQFHLRDVFLSIPANLAASSFVIWVVITLACIALFVKACVCKFGESQIVVSCEKECTPRCTLPAVCNRFTPSACKQFDGLCSSCSICVNLFWRNHGRKISTHVSRQTE